MNKKTNDDVIRKSVDFEITLAHLIKTSERRAWIIAIVSSSLSICLAIGYVLILPLKEKVPYLIMADAYTGRSSLTKLTDDFNVEEISSNQILNKSNVARYVIARESYDIELIYRKDWIVVNSMSSGPALASYRTLYSGSALDPDIIYGREKTARVNIKSVVLSSLNNNGKFDGATVNFERVIINRYTQAAESVESFIATLSFEYKSNLKMPENYRIENPMGFRVTAYRLDPEIVSSKDLILKEVSNQNLRVK